MNNKFKPVVAFDVDGVLRVSKIDNREDSTLEGHRILMNKNEYPDFYHGSPRWDQNGESERVDHFSIVGKEFLQSLISDGKTEPVWATTWQRWANYYFAPVLGIPDLPVAVKTLEPESANYFHCSPAWKTFQLSRQFDGRPLIWIDDNMVDRYGESLVDLRRPIDRAITLEYKINPFTGIANYNVEEIREWIEQVSTVDGQKELREKRREKMRKIYASNKKLEIKKTKQKEIYNLSQSKMEEMFPNQFYFNREIARLAQHKEFDQESIEYAMKRFSILADSSEIFEKIYIPRYHRKKGVAEYREIDSDRYDF